MSWAAVYNDRDLANYSMATTSCNSLSGEESRTSHGLDPGQPVPPQPEPFLPPCGSLPLMSESSVNRPTFFPDGTVTSGLTVGSRGARPRCRQPRPPGLGRLPVLSVARASTLTQARIVVKRDRLRRPQRQSLRDKDKDTGRDGLPVRTRTGTSGQLSVPAIAHLWHLTPELPRVILARSHPVSASRCDILR